MLIQFKEYLTFENIYLWINFGVLPFWIMLILIPNSKFTQILVNSVPRPDPSKKWQSFVNSAIVEQVESSLQKGCSFFEYCPVRMNECKIKSPPLFKIKQNHKAACYLQKSI